jgi:hypothetical protein
MPSELDKVFDLIKQTGESAIVLDENHGKSYVFLPLEKYRDLLSRSHSAERHVHSSMTDDEEHPNMEPVNLEAEPEFGMPSELVEIPTKSLESEGNSEDKYFFEKLDNESSESETSKLAGENA